MACTALIFGCRPLLARNHLPVPLSPCELQGTCSFKDAVSLTTDFGSSRVTLVDQKGYIFIVAYVGPGVIFKRQDGTQVKSMPGSPEEQCLLATLKASYTAAFTPPMNEAPRDAAGRKKFWTQYTVNRLIGIFQRRCATGKEWDFPQR